MHCGNYIKDIFYFLSKYISAINVKIKKLNFNQKTFLTFY